MLLNLKRVALMMLAGAFWLTPGGPAWAESPTAQRERFIALLANRENHAIARRLAQHFTQLNTQTQELLQRQTKVSAKLTNPPAPPVLVNLNRQDQRLQQDSTRILRRLQKLNNTLSTGGQHSSALNILRSELTKQESLLGQQIQTVQSYQRAAATPFAPGGF